MGRAWIVMGALLFAGAAGAQTTQTECRTVGGVTRCTSTPRGGGVDWSLVNPPPPTDYAAQQEQRARNRQIELQNQLLQRQVTMQAAPGYDAKQCKKAASDALKADDLALARDVLTACVAKAQ